MAKRADTIAFFKVENDGFDLGAQRRPVEGSDLPQVQAELAEYIRCLGTSETLDNRYLNTGLVVKKERIAADGDYNLTGERLKENEDIGRHNWPMVRLGDICDGILSGGTPSTKVKEYWDGDIPWITSADIVDINTAIPRRYITQEAIKESATNLIPTSNVIVVTRVGLGKLLKNSFDLCISQDSQGLILKDQVNPDYLVRMLKPRVEEFKRVSQGSTIQGVTKSLLSKIQVPLPPLEVQQEIVAEIEGYQRVIDGARAVVENYRPHIVVDPEWPVVALGDVCSLISGQHVNKDDYNTDRTGLGYLTGPADFGEKCTSFSKWTTKPKVIAEKGDVLITVKGSGLGKVNLLGAKKAAIGRQLMAIRSDAAIPGYIYSLLAGMYDHIQSLGNGAAIPGITRDDVLRLQIPLPDLAEQKSIIADLDRDMELVNGNRELVMRFEEKIQVAIGKVWDNGATKSR